MLMCPAMMSATDCGVLLYGMWVMSSPNFCFMNSTLRCCAVPVPGVLKLSLPLLSLAYLMSSGTLRGPSAGLITKMKGDFT